MHGGAWNWQNHSRDSKVQTSGTLEQASLATLLETMQAERATGTLAVTHSEQTCSLYFLFGHLFHAAGDLGQGEEAVVTALAWNDGQFTFDPRAKLPAEETIKSATGDLLAEADRRRSEPAAEAAAPLSPSAWGDLSATSEEPTPAAVPIAVAESQIAYPAAAPAPVGPSGPWGGDTGSSNGEVTTPEPYSPLRAPAASGPVPVYGNPDAAPLNELYPLPSGKAIYEGLKSAFVDFPKLLRTLDNDKHTGYVRLDGADFSGVLLLHDGHVLEALFSEERIDQGTSAFQKLRRRMEAGQGLLDVIDLPGEIVVALAQLLTARPLFTGLLGRFVNFDALVEYLAEEKIDGSLVVSGGAEMGVILFRKGAVLASYTASNRELASDTRAVTALAADRGSRIEVKSGTSTPEGIDVESALR
jgi:hypothetical protein